MVLKRAIVFAEPCDVLCFKERMSKIVTTPSVYRIRCTSSETDGTYLEKLRRKSDYRETNLY